MERQESLPKMLNEAQKTRQNKVFNNKNPNKTIKDKSNSRSQSHSLSPTGNYQRPCKCNRIHWFFNICHFYNISWIN